MSICSIALKMPKFDSNLGGVLRACTCYNADLILVEGARFKHSAQDTTKAERHIPVVHGNIIDNKPVGAKIVAVDLIPGAIDLIDFKHPDNALYVFGPEDGTLGKDVTDIADYVVYVPTKQCMNLAATVNVILYDRLAKETLKNKNSKV